MRWRKWCSSTARNPACSASRKLQDRSLLHRAAPGAARRGRRGRGDPAEHPCDGGTGGDPRGQARPGREAAGTDGGGSAAANGRRGGRGRDPHGGPHVRVQPCRAEAPRVGAQDRSSASFTTSTAPGSTWVCIRPTSTSSSISPRTISPSSTTCSAGSPPPCRPGRRAMRTGGSRTSPTCACSTTTSSTIEGYPRTSTSAGWIPARCGGSRRSAARRWPSTTISPPRSRSASSTRAS